MNQELKNIFKGPYDSINNDSSDWKVLLNELFKDKAKDFYKTPIERKEDKKIHDDVESILEFGDIILDDKSRIKFYEVELKDHKQITSRVGLRNIIHSEVIPGDTDGIIATYFNPKSQDWRLTFISKSLYWDDEFNEIKEETHPKRYTYVLGEGESVKTAVNQFEWLFNEVRSREITIEDIIKTFSVEKISNEFFNKYFEHFISFTDYISDNKSAFSFFKKQVDKNKTNKEQQEDAEKLVRHFVKKLLGRIVFLYFLQKKGWLGVPMDGDWGEGLKDFMSRLFKDHENKKNYYNEVLDPLFFSALNVDRRGKENDVFPITNTRVPYLNGGLFEKDKIEPDSLKIKPLLFEELFDFFDQYNFTIDENNPDDKDIGIDPEMLGLIFENLLEDNKDKGTFYTPKEVVYFMCKESICNYLIGELKSKCSPQELEEIKILVFENGKIDLKVIELYASDIDKALSTVRICDPAIGSGAFPMGMVLEIFRLKRLVSTYLDIKDFFYLKEKLKIIRHSIYGVDIDKGAVDIARLRFWLSLIVDEQEPQPLPNLDYKIMQGDSLKESFENFALDKIMEDEKPQQRPQLTLGDEFNEPQQELYLTSSEKSDLKYWVDQYFSLEPLIKKQELHTKIDNAVINHIHKNVTVRKKEIKKQISKIELTYANAGKNITLLKSGKDVKTFRGLREELGEIEAQEKRLIKVQETTERPYFLWNLFFDKVLNEGNKGFDIVIGNPPYGGIKIDDEVRENFGLQSKDPYGAFISMAIKKLLKPNGILCYIVSDTWLTIKSHKPLRDIVLEYQLKNVIRIHTDCFKATVNSCVFTVIKTPVGKGEKNIIAADLTNISTRKQVPEFRDKLFNLQNSIGQYTPDFAVYSYPQSLLQTNSQHPIVVGSPKLFQLMNNTLIEKEERKINNEKVEVRKVPFNDKTIELVKFGDVADAKQGLATGDNKYYIYQNPDARGTYRNINEYLKYLLNEKDLDKIRSNEDIRKKIIEKGIHKKKSEKGFDPNRYFEGRFIAPYDKGGESDTESGWLPNYHVPTNYFIDWSSDAVSRLKNYKIADRIRDRNENKIIKDSYLITNAAVLRNIEDSFTESISSSRVGEYSPTFRAAEDSLFDSGCSNIFTEYYKRNVLLGYLCSKLFRYIFILNINHTVNSQSEDINDMVAPTILKGLEKSVKSIILKQKTKPRYNFFLKEQKEIDNCIYSMFGLNKADINEVETWFARRYPKLAKYAHYQSPEEILQEELVEEEVPNKVRDLINAGESKVVEFKSTLRYCLREKSPQPYIEHSVIKTLAAFLNSEGGTLFIGVDDEKNILGLEGTDFTTFKGSDKKDEFQKHFDNLIQNNFGNDKSHKFELEFIELDGKMIVSIHIKDKASGPVMTPNPKDKKAQDFYIRRHASTVSLTMYEMYNYAKEHWG